MKETACGAVIFDEVTELHFNEAVLLVQLSKTSPERFISK